MNIVHKLTEWRGAGFLFAGVFVAFSVAYAFIVPLWEAPDERHHFHYVQYLAKTKTIPPLIYSPRIADSEERVRQAFNPPLYYLLGVVFVRQSDDYVFKHIKTIKEGRRLFQYDEKGASPSGSDPASAARVMRFISVLMGAMVVASIWRMGRLLFSEDRTFAFLAAGIAAVHPQLALISASVNNENLANAASACATLLLVEVIRHGNATKRLVLLGFFLGVALLAKINTIFLLPCAAVTLGVSVYLKSGPAMAKRMLGSLVIVFGVSAAVAGWWFVRNALEFGDPLASRYLAHVSAAFESRIPRTTSEFLQTTAYMFMNFWGVAGQFAVYMHPLMYCTYGLLVLWGFIGLAFLFKRGGELRVSKEQKVTFLLFAMQVALVVSMAMWYTLTVCPAQGRHLFVGLPAILILLATGILNNVSVTIRRTLAVTIPGLLLLIQVGYLFTRVLPAFMGA